MEVLPWLLLAVVIISAVVLQRRRPRVLPAEPLFELSPDPVLLVDSHGIIRMANRAVHHFLGYDDGSMVGRTLDILVPEEIRSQHHHLVALFFSSTGKRRMNNRIWINDARGQKINAEIHLALVDYDGEPMAIASILDTSTLWMSERKLREQHKAYDELFEHSAVGICSVSLGGRFLRVNRRLCDLLGYSGEELLERCFQDITHPDDLELDIGNVNGLLNSAANSYSIEKRYLHQGGHYFWANLTVTLIRDEQNFPDYFISVIEDISNRKQSELLLLQSETKFRTIAETIQSVVWMSTPAMDQMLFVNPAYEYVWGRSCASLYDNPQSFLDGIYDDDRARVRAAIERYKEGRWEIEYRVEHPQNGLRHIFDSGKGVFNNAGKLEYIIGLATDISDQVKAKADMAQALEQAHQATERLNLLIRTDPLTGCINRQALYEELEHQLELYRRYQTPCSLLFIDLNDFKKINDTFGHIAGDETLQALAEHIRQHIRATDILARYAGDEFVVVLPQSNVREASLALRNLRNNVLRHQTPTGTFPVHFSIGLAYVGYPDVADANSWIEVADQAMYLDKSAHAGSHAHTSAESENASGHSVDMTLPPSATDANDRGCASEDGQ
ncbi:PAS domain S-box protein [Thalassolituus pacificus]|uniref:PAS domain S-box protein n=1 Tax=Thalassolituus pacificus TaxID=2975440 RepID=A0A9X3AT12_9GAMM|nr:PAS domain S-box protein [Thalassolituus pacificus]MCT7361055.1 PAS domain S-box protein [Thalassolituus pacificus]